MCRAAYLALLSVGECGRKLEMGARYQLVIHAGVQECFFMEACARWLDTLAEEGPGSKVGAVILHSTAPFGIELFIRIWLADVVPFILVSVRAC